MTKTNEQTNAARDAGRITVREWDGHNGCWSAGTDGAYYADFPPGDCDAEPYDGPTEGDALVRACAWADYLTSPVLVELHEYGQITARILTAAAQRLALPLPE